MEKGCILMGSEKNIKFYHVDAFTEDIFKGNTAVVCVMGNLKDTTLMQNIAKEMNVSETAFICYADKEGFYDIRWFTPAVEMDLCGHATMAAAKVLYDIYGVKQDNLVFKGRSGELGALRQGNLIKLDFAADEIESEIECSRSLMKALGLDGYVKAVVGKNTRKLVIHVEKAETVLALKPDFTLLRETCFDTVVKGVGVTAKGIGGYDIMTRYFNPWAGVNEDPVTGSVHTLLATYWSEILCKKELRAYQASKRGGEMLIKLLDNGRLDMWGKAIVVSAGELYI